ncbi:MAG: hypothetical protein LBS77_03255 [Desulfovibrio sp.]|jgi:hypothetical protein|nr:hypothetical protein [Desulfovibrio sp.]
MTRAAESILITTERLVEDSLFSAHPELTLVQKHVFPFFAHMMINLARSIVMVALGNQL